MKIIFCDTNIIFWLFLNISRWIENNHSLLFQLAENHAVYISSYVVYEATRNIKKKYGIDVTSEHIQKFLNSASNLFLIQSEKSESYIFWYVYDQDDGQILQDAIDVWADYLITQNIQDFQEREIFDKRWIRVTNRIPESLLQNL